jgi:hypothetical protein
MPSLHVGWALLIAVVVIRTANSPWRWATIAHPIITTAVVVVTANHYWIDAIVAALLLGLVLLITPRPSAVPPSRLWRRLTRRRAELIATRGSIPSGSLRIDAGERESRPDPS